MSHSHPAGLLATYNSLTDKHLAGYFNNTRIRRHLLRSGLITRSGRILSEKEYKVNNMKQDHQKYIRECLARAIFHKVLDMERYHQLEIKRKLDALARKERIQKLKGEHTRRYIEDNMPVLTPHPPAGPKTNRGHSVLAEEGHSSPLTLTAPRPYTAPGNMQPPVRLQPLLSNRQTRNGSKITSGSKLKGSLLENEALFPLGGKKAMMKFRNYMDNSQREDLYQLPHINSYHTPVPPTPQPQAGKSFRDKRLESWRRKRLRPITAPNGLEPLFGKDPGRIYKTAPHSNAVITMVYFGKNVHLSYDDIDFRDEIKIYQQHCGGENLCVYKGKLLEKDTFQFISKRHHGFPFSLTFFLNGIQVNRISSCCEFKHRRSTRLGGKRGYFGFVCVEKASPCYRCIIAMGLDRKPSSTKPKKEKMTEKKEEPPKKSQGKLRKDRMNAPSKRNEMERKESSVSAAYSAEEIKLGVKEVRTAIEEMEWKGKSGQDVWEEDQDHSVKYDYEEDFEIDDEKQDEKVDDDEDQADDQMSGGSKTPTEGEKDSRNPENETETSSEKAVAAHDSENEDTGCSDSEEDDRQDVKTMSSISSRSHPYSSESEDDSTEVGGEADSVSEEGSSRSSSPQDLQENDPEKPHFPIKKYLETEVEGQEITKLDGHNGPWLAELSGMHVTEGKPTMGTQALSESEPKESRRVASSEVRAKSQLQKDAGLSGVEEEVGQITGEAQEPGHCCSNSAPELSPTDDGVTPMRKPELNLGRGIEKRAAIGINEQPEQAAQEVHTLKEESMKEDESSQPKDSDAYVGVREEAGMQEDDTHHPQHAEMDAGLREREGMQEDGTCHPQDADMDVGLRERAGMQEDGTCHPQDAGMDMGLREKAGMQEDGTCHPQEAAMDAGLRKRAGMQKDGTCHPQDADMGIGLRDRTGMPEDGTCHPQDADMDAGLRERAGMQEDGTCHPQDADMDAGLRERAGMQEDGTCYSQDANMDVGLRERAGTSEVPLGERSPTRAPPASAEQSAEKGERHLNVASEAEAGKAGSSRHGEKQATPSGKAAAEGSVFLSVEQAADRQRDENLDRQALLQTQMEIGTAVSEAGQELEKAEFTDSTGLSSETLEEAAVLKEAGTSDVKEVEREVGFPRTDGEQGEEEALTELEVMGPVEDTGSERKGVSEESGLGGERAATERKGFLEEAPFSASTGEAQASPREVFRGHHEELCKEDTAREGVIADTESTMEQDLQAVFPGELVAAGGIEKVERPTPPLRETGSEREEETGPEVLKTEDLLGEQKVKGEEEGTVREVGFEEEDWAPCPETEAHADDVEPTGATEMGEATKLLEDPPKERTITLSEATPQFEKSPKESEATATEHKGGEELPGQESEALWHQGRGLSHDGEGLLGAPGPEPADKAQGPEGFFTARCEEWAAKELDSSAGSERLEEDLPLQAQEDIMIMTQENLPEERHARAVEVCGEAKDEKPQGGGSKDKEYPPGTVTSSLTEQNWTMGGSTVEAEEDPHGGGIEEPTAEQREDSAESKSAARIPAASSAANAQRETRDRAGEALEAAAEERTGTEDATPRTEKVAVVEEVTSAGATVETEQEEDPEAQDREGGEAKDSGHTGTAGEDTGATRKDGEHQSGAAEEFRGSVSQRETA
ncbi:glutamate-rich protein 3 isoform X2 [Mus pahari]|uniref:glutamate-rich protein 3 isoform X2 n=1 Tax=Mus pahari TaxID=10093 RepID=UPI000FC70C50|nr:glutamate-rich protein 3 isoform X2 [Mus pahari]